MKKLTLFGIILLAVLFLLSILAPTSSLGIKDAAENLWKLLKNNNAQKSAALILLKIRIPRAASCILCGAALSGAGLLLQSALGNTLASPGILGINAGAGFFTLLASVLVPFSGAFLTAASFAGAAAASIAVFLISLKSNVSKTTVILAGVAISSLFAAASDVLITLKPEAVQDKIAFSLGGFQDVSTKNIFLCAALVFAGLALAFILGRGIDLFALGDENASALGLNVMLHRTLCIFCAALLASAAVSICGLLGFVGLIVPNAVRFVCRSTFNKRLILCCIFGSSLLLLCDTIARVIFFPYEIPAGLVMSVTGSPVFVWLLIKKRRRLSA